MQRIVLSLLVLCLLSNPSYADKSEDQARSFAKVYASLCLKHLSDLEALRTKLTTLPTLPPEKAALFLSGNPGDVWPVPDKHGKIVLALPKEKSLCAVYVRRANTETAKNLFIDLVTSAPAPLTSKLLSSTTTETKANGQTNTISYEWSNPNAAKKIIFTLTTASSDKANLQILGSAALVRN